MAKKDTMQNLGEDQGELLAQQCAQAPVVIAVIPEMIEQEDGTMQLGNTFVTAHKGLEVSEPDHRALIIALLHQAINVFENPPTGLNPN